MPIMTERYSNPRWGFLDGLGAAPVVPPLPNPDVRIMLIDPATGQFSNTRFESYKQYLISAKDRAWKDYADIQKAVNSVGRTSSSTMKQAAEKLKSSTGLPMTFSRLTRFTDQLSQVWDPNGAFWDNPAGYQSILRGFQTEISNLQSDASTLGIASDMSFYTALGDRALVMIKDTYDYGVAVAELAKDSLEKAGRKVKETVDKIVDAAGDLIQTPFDLISFLKNWGPWIIGGGFVAFYVLPTVLRARREGSAALEEDLRAGRGAVERGARSAGSAAYRAGKAGAAAYTGNPALLMGAPKRRVQRRRRK
jgi:hypothetical protein